MTDRFYPLGKHSAEDVWKSTYELANEMRSFQRSAYPPGYAGHEPGARDKFGFSTPGPDAWKLTKGDLCLREDIDIAEPRRNLAVPRMQVTDERVTFQDLDVPEMDRSYKSGIVSPMHRSMAKSRSTPTVRPKPAPNRMSELPPAEVKMEDDHFSYFVPKAINREGKDRLMSRSLSKLYKHPEKKVMLPFAGDGTGFRTQSSATEWWPAAAKLHEEPSAYQSQFQRPSFFRMSPLRQNPFSMAGRSISDGRSSVTFDPPGAGDGNGSIRLGTPTVEERAQRHARFAKSYPVLDSNAMMKSFKQPENMFQATPAARFGYMPPGYGRIDRSGSSSSGNVAEDLLSEPVLAKVVGLYQAMDRNSNEAISRSEAKLHFKKFAQVSADAMFNEVDQDNNDEITLDEFVEFWQQVRRSGYAEDDISLELDELLRGNVWVDYNDDRDVGACNS